MIGLAIGLAFLSGFGLGAVALVVWLGFGAMLLARRSSSPGAVLLVAIFTGLGVWSGYAYESDLDVMLAPGPFEGMLGVTDGSFLTQSGQRFLAGTEDEDATVLCAYASVVPRVVSGDRVFATGRVSLLSDLPDMADIAARIRGCDAQIRIESLRIIEPGSGSSASIARFRIRLSDSLMQIAPGDTGALLSGLVTGDDGGLSARASRAFLTSGTTHITAISGSNFATIALLLGVLATASMRRNVLFVSGASLAIWLYAIMVGLEPSAFRAALLATAVLIGRWIGRRPDVLTLTVLLAAGQIILRPRDFSTLAFQLSLAATIALIVVFDGLEREERWSWIVSLVFTIFAAQLATVPILAWTLGTMNGVGLMANILVGPLAGFVFPIALVGALILQVVPILGQTILYPAIWSSHLIVVFVEWCDRSLPGIVQLGPSTPAALVVLTLACWLVIFWLSRDLRRMARYGMSIVRAW